jgi:hypothetical protein
MMISIVTIQTEVHLLYRRRGETMKIKFWLDENSDMVGYIEIHCIKEMELFTQIVFI